ncbi:hypothetical protein SAY87_021811 [Trapa incisa]|uniref:Myb-like domain-containing protein n=1 Tax=Trapa incisa TaxID=236973 RepID=A0AAN7JSH7_9MYRT|nr:hypothetical protein SAY87_021811 [Trapa incisa]
MKGEGRSRKRLWNEEEDRILMDFVRVHGKGKWNRAAKMTAVGENPPRTAHVDTSWDWEKPTAHNNFGGSQPVSTTDGGSRQAMGPDSSAEAVEMDNAWDPMRSFDNWPQPDYEDIDIYAPPLADGIERMDECFLDFILHGL